MRKYYFYHCAGRWMLAFIFLFGSFLPASAQAQSAGWLVPAAMLAPTRPYVPFLLKGLKVYPQQPLRFDFIVDPGQSGLAIDDAGFRDEAQKMVKYFLAALTIKESDLWVTY